MTDPVALCAGAVAGWHASWLTALGLRSEADVDAWRALEPSHFIYFGAITLRREAPAATVADAPGSICDSWQTLDLAPLGFKVWRREPWYLRPAGALPAADPPAELELVRVTSEAEVEEFELVSVRGFDSEEARIEPGAMHPATILTDERMALWLARVDGKAVGASMGYRTDAAVGVFGVTTVASARRRGYGGALTRAAMAAENGLPAVLAPSPAGASLYRSLGFGPVGELSIWASAAQAQ
jgi:GNAT acetyltransferase-like protein